MRVSEAPDTVPSQPVDQAVAAPAETARGGSEGISGPPAALTTAWAHALDSLADGALPPQQRAWMRLTRPLAIVEDTAVLAAPNEFAKEVLDTRLRPLIVEALSAELGRDVQVAVTVEQSNSDTPAADEADTADRVEDEELEETDGTEIAWPPRPPGWADRAAGAPAEPARLNPKYTFDTFVIGS